MKRNRILNTTNGLLATMGVKLCNYMFRPVFVAIVRLQSSSVKSLYNMLKGRLMMKSQSYEKLQSSLINLVYIV